MAGGGKVAVPVAVAISAGGRRKSSSTSCSSCIGKREAVAVKELPIKRKEQHVVLLEINPFAPFAKNFAISLRETKRSCFSREVRKEKR